MRSIFIVNDKRNWTFVWRNVSSRTWSRIARDRLASTMRKPKCETSTIKMRTWKLFPHCLIVETGFVSSNALEIIQPRVVEISRFNDKRIETVALNGIEKETTSGGRVTRVSRSCDAREGRVASEDLLRRVAEGYSREGKKDKEEEYCRETWIGVCNCKSCNGGNPRRESCFGSGLALQNRGNYIFRIL